MVAFALQQQSRAVVDGEWIIHKAKIFTLFRKCVPTLAGLWVDCSRAVPGTQWVPRKYVLNILINILRVRWLSGIPNSSLSTPWETVKDREAWGAAACPVTETDTTEGLNNINYLI